MIHELGRMELQDVALCRLLAQRMSGETKEIHKKHCVLHTTGLPAILSWIYWIWRTDGHSL